MVSVLDLFDLSMSLMLKIGKRLYVRFWVGRSKFHANVARFKREYMKGSVNVDKTKNESNKRKFDGSHKNVKNTVIGKSFVSVVKTSRMPIDKESPLSIVLEDDCLNAKDLTLSLMGRVKGDGLLELCVKNKVNFVGLQETKMGSIDLSSVRSCWGNSNFDYVHSDSVGNSGGILCIWDPNSFRRSSFTRSDYFVIVRGVWLKSGIDLMIVVVYAPQEAKEKRMLWDYLAHVSNQWVGKLVMMGDFNEVRYKSDRYGLNFNAHDAEIFNSFIYNAGLDEVPLGGSAYTWCLKSASKMSKLDRFFVSENLLSMCPNITAITLERFISDHRPILLREVRYDYGPIPFRFYRYWLEVDGFDKLVRDSWNVAPVNKKNVIRNFMGKLKFLKDRIRSWLSIHRSNSRGEIYFLKEELRSCDEVIDKGDCSNEVVHKQTSGDSHKIHQVNNIQAAVMFDKPSVNRACIDTPFPVSLSIDQKEDMERRISKEEVKRVVWDCGVDKSPGPDGFSFSFYRHFWPVIEKDVFEAVDYFFMYGEIPNRCNSNFIALIPKILDANMVKDFRPISFDLGELYTRVLPKTIGERLVVCLS
ncbi:RNA-directed DNA polymerase, eukaryota [Tanacetum coccineum]